MTRAPAPRKRHKPPGYRRHSTGQAFVEIRGHRYYLGQHGTDASHAAYKRKLAELWSKPPDPAPTLGLTPAQVDRLSIIDLVVAYRPYAEDHYRKNGRPTTTFRNLAPVMRRLRELFGETLARDFGPLRFQALRDTWIRERKAVKTVNEYANSVRRVFRWGVKNELIPPSVYAGLKSVDGVKRGRSEARDTAPVPPVADEVIEATYPHLPPIVADMIRFQRLTGCRPAEVCILRRCDVNRSGERGAGKRGKALPLFEVPVWEYRPATHKTEHLGHERVIFIGPRAQMILKQYLVGDADGYCFSPAESELQRREVLYDQRQTPLPFGNSPGTNRQPHPRWKPGAHYTTNSYRKAIQRACDLAFSPPAELLGDQAALAAWRKVHPPPVELKGNTTAVRQWHQSNPPPAELLGDVAAVRAWRKAHRWAPNQIRHATGTDVRSKFGPDAAQVILGHKHVKTTEIYALADREKAANVAREVG